MTDARLLGAIARRVKEEKNSALELFRPNPKQEQFLKVLIDGVNRGTLNEVAVTGPNRVGKTVMVAVWLAAMAQDKPIILADGTRLSVRPKRWGDDQLLLWIVGYNWRHNGENIYPKLFKPGLFHLLPEKGTLNKWRVYDPSNPEDEKRRDERRAAPPLIPASNLDDELTSYASKKDNELQSVELKENGTRIVFYASTGDVAQGMPVNLIWIDEEIAIDDHYTEWQTRVGDTDGAIVWTGWPTLSVGNAFSELQERADQQVGQEQPRSICFRFEDGDNKYTNTSTRKYMLGTMSEEEYAARGLGRSDSSRWLMYPQFSQHIHRAYGQDPTGDDALAAALRGEAVDGIRKTMPIPNDWTRYIILDPGHANCGVLKIAIPPPSFGMLIGGERSARMPAFVVPYKEYYLHFKSADQVAEIVAADSDGEVFEDIVCDAHAYCQTPMGMAGTTIGGWYERAFRERGLRSQRRGSSFSMGGDDVAVRQNMLRSMMSLHRINSREAGPNKRDAWDSPRLRIVTETCPNLIRQLSKYRRAKDSNDQPTDRAARDQKIDLAVCLEYAAIKSDLIYVPVVIKSPEVPSLNSMVNGLLRTRFASAPLNRGNDGQIYCGPGRPVA